MLLFLFNADFMMDQNKKSQVFCSESDWRGDSALSRQLPWIIVPAPALLTAGTMQWHVPILLKRPSMSNVLFSVDPCWRWYGWNRFLLSLFLRFARESMPVLTWLQPVPLLLSSSCLCLLPAMALRSGKVIWTTLSFQLKQCSPAYCLHGSNWSFPQTPFPLSTLVWNWITLCTTGPDDPGFQRAAWLALIE